LSLDRRTAGRTLRQIADLLEVTGGNAHRARAFANAARAVERAEGDLGELVASGEVLQLRGVGRGTAAVLEELAAGKQPAALEELIASTPPGVRELLTVPGLGPKKVRSLWRDLGVAGVGELEYACRENRLIELPGFGVKTQERLLEALTFAKKSRARRLLHEAWAGADDLKAMLETRFPHEVRVDVAGELRRRCETVGSLELVVTSADEEEVGRVLAGAVEGVTHSGPGLWDGETESGFPVRVRVARPAEASAALLWTTGSAGHLRALAERAEAMGLSLREDGLWHGQERLGGEGEMAIYEALGCWWIPPELREDGDEVAAAVGGSAPELVTIDDLLGALHNHTTDSDGAASVRDMALAAGARGWSFFGVADHSPAARYANGVDADRLRRQWQRIDEINADEGMPRVVKGLEADILPDGSLDIPDGCGDGLEYVVASVHSSFKMDPQEQTRRLVKAAEHPACRVLGHPTGRLLLARPGYELDLERVLIACAENGVAAEINASPYRLDLDWRWARRALQLGVRLIVNPDAHSPEGLDDLRWGVAVARKAGARRRDVVNCADIGEFLAST
jgi:DNA polymerase (family 10)